jgi:putative peptidoglycan lipid II flippase
VINQYKDLRGDKAPTDIHIAGAILRNSLSVSVVIVLVKILAMGKEAVVAYFFGTSGALDTYLIAFLLPSLAVNVFGASFQSALVPALVGSKNAGTDIDRDNFVNACLTRYTFALVILTVILAIIAPLFIELVGYGYLSTGELQATYWTYLLLPVFFFGSLSAFFVGILAAEKRFLLAAVIPAVTSVITIIFLVVFSGDWGIESLAIGVVTGYIAEAFILALVVRSAGIHLHLSWMHLSDRTRKVFQQTRYIAVGAALMSGTTLVDQAAATWLDEGAVATLSYATRLTAVLLTIAASLSTVSLPYFSDLVETRNWSSLRVTIRMLGGVVVIGSAIVVAGVAYFSEPIVALMFERGNFSQADTRQVAWVQAIIVMQMPFYILVQLASRIFFAVKMGRLVIWISFVIFASNFIGDVVLLQVWGIAGIALATVISYVIGTIFIMICAWNWGK